MFSHLHTHSSYSDGLASPTDLVAHAAHLGYTHLALTDHNTTSGHAAFLLAAKEHHIMPILGVETVIATRVGKGHMVVLPHNQEAYQRLYRLVQSKRVIRLKELVGCGYVTSGCLGGVIAHHLFRNDYWTARDALLEYRDALGSYFLIEVQPTFGALLGWLLSMSRMHGIPAVATNDVHYLHASDSVYHQNAGLYLADENEMRSFCPFDSYQDAITVADEIAQICAWKQN